MSSRSISCFKSAIMSHARKTLSPRNNSSGNFVTNTLIYCMHPGSQLHQLPWRQSPWVPPAECMANWPFHGAILRWLQALRWTQMAWCWWAYYMACPVSCPRWLGCHHSSWVVCRIWIEGMLVTILVASSSCGSLLLWALFGLLVTSLPKVSFEITDVPTVPTYGLPSPAMLSRCRPLFRGGLALTSCNLTSGPGAAFAVSSFRAWSRAMLRDMSSSLARCCFALSPS
jgi:hypothetical protein